MVSGPDRRPDLSGVPAALQPGRAALGAPVPPADRSSFRAMVQVAVWLCIAAAVGFGLAFMGYDHPLLDPNAPTVEEQAAEVSDAERAESVRRAQDMHRDALRDAAMMSKAAQHQHDQAIKAVAAARELAEDPNSATARAALDEAMGEIASSAGNSQPADRTNWKAEDYARALREGRSLTD